MKAYRHKRPAERYAVLRARLADERQVIWDVVVATQNSWHRYQRAQIFDTVEHRVAFRTSVVFGLRRFAEEYERLLRLIAEEIDRAPSARQNSDAADGPALVRTMSVYVDHVRPRVVPVGIRHTLARYLDMRFRCPEEVADDQLRVLAVGLWGLWDRLEDSLREFSAWLTEMEG